MHSILCMQYIGNFAPKNPDLMEEANGSYIVKIISDLLLLYNKKCIDVLDYDNIDAHKKLIRDEIVNRNLEIYNKSPASSYLFLDAITPVEFIGSKAKILDDTSEDDDMFLDMIHEISQSYFNVLINDENSNIDIESIHQILFIIFIDVIERGAPTFIIYPDDDDDFFGDDDDDWDYYDDDDD